MSPDAEVLSTTEERLEALTTQVVDRNVDLAKFLDDDFLKPPAVEGVVPVPVSLAGCRSLRGATGHAWQS